MTSISSILETCSNGPYQTQIQNDWGEWRTFTNNIDDRILNSYLQARVRTTTPWPWRILDSKGNTIASGPGNPP